MDPAADAAGPEGPRTLAVDCGGSKLKALVLDPAGEPLTERVRVVTPYPCPPDLLVRTLVRLVEPLGDFERVSVGFPGVVRGGRVLATPHYVTEAGPFTARSPALVEAWASYDVQSVLAEAFGRQTRVVNDAEVVALAVGTGHGLEVVLTLGTGLGFALLDDGVLLPKLEMSAAPFGAGTTFDQMLGNAARKKIGNEAWTARVVAAVEALRPVLWWDRCVVGGGNVKHLTAPLPPDVEVVPNLAGLLGGVRLWTDRSHGPDQSARSTAPNLG